MPDNAEIISGELNIGSVQVAAVLSLLSGGGTVPFIARYRKEQTGSLDEVLIATIRDRAQQLEELNKRKEAVIKSIDEQGKLNPGLRKEIENADTLAQVEDLYLPYKPKRKTRAAKAIEKGLEPLANWLMTQQQGSITEKAAAFISTDNDLPGPEEVLQGARDILAERINEDADARQHIRTLFLKKAVVHSRLIRGKEKEGQKYRDYFDWEESLKSIPSHRMLAIRRGEREGILSLRIIPDSGEAIQLLEKKFVKGTSESSEQVSLAVEDGYKRLMQPSIETDIRLLSKQKADEEAIVVFTENMQRLLMAPPLGSKRILAIDPGFRTGCKIVVLNRQGKLLDHAAIYPHEPQKKRTESEALVRHWINEYQIEAIAIGNGTASRETEAFVQSLALPPELITVTVNESGASIYSASAVAREEFPDHDITVRGAVSIGRRLMDPLAELVKIDPKSVGVGQYQHDVDQSLLKKSLDDTVVSCVNKVGVELNTASKQLLSYVAGLGPSLAENIVEYRNKTGAFRTRHELLSVPRLGEKAFEQAAGFLRIREATQVLDETAVHPERYPVVEQMAADLGCSVRELVKNTALRKRIRPENYITDEVGLPTLNDILAELEKPGRDPRASFSTFAFSEQVKEIDDLREGMTLPGVVTNVTNFGAFVDIGVHQDGLVHISQLADTFVRDPHEMVKVQDRVQVRVLEVDLERKRISLSMKQPRKKPEKRSRRSKKDNMEDKLAALKRKFDR